MKQTPILFLGDSPDLRTGLGRIGRDLASLCASLPEFRVGYLGRGGMGSRQLPFVQYNFPETAQWGEQHIEQAWNDFAGNDTGVIFSIWDVSRLGWFAMPHTLPDGNLRRFLTSGRFQRWGYFPVDAYGPGQRLSVASVESLRRFNRVLGYTIWGADVLSKCVGRQVDWIPHGISLDTFQPREKTGGRLSLGVKDSDYLVGCVMTNQARKDWGLACSAIAAARKSIPHLKFWAHIDVFQRSHCWDLRALLADFNIEDIARVTFSGSFEDKEMSYYYSACDLTILPSLGEGFGYPIVESLACGVPVIHGNYGGGAELLPSTNWLVNPVAHRMEGIHNAIRPVYEPNNWAEGIVASSHLHEQASFYRDSVAHLEWKKLWPSCWAKWFKEGLG